MQDWETFTPPGTPGPAIVMYRVTITTDSGTIMGHASHGWDVLAKLRNAMDRGHTHFLIEPITPAEARALDEKKKGSPSTGEPLR